MAKKKKKKIKSHVKRLKIQQKKHPMSPEKYKQKLRVAKRKDFFRVFRRVVLVLCALVVVLFGAGNYMLKQKTGENLFECMADAKQMVEASSVDTFRLSETSYIYSDDGTQIAKLAESDDATYLEYDEIPADVVNAFVAVEDRSFWTNDGIDYKGIARVCINYIRTRGEVAEGASTITQQLARGTFLSNEKTLSRKIKEIFIARELTKKYTKEQIMEFYCNTCCFANGIYGVEDASQTYFGCSVDELTLSEVAYICAIPNRPEYYNPLKNSENAVTRRNKILEDMFECGYITKTAGEDALMEKISVSEPEEDETFYNYEVTYAINCTVRYFMKLDGFEFKYEFDSNEEYETYNDEYDEAYQQAKHKLYTGGYKVTTTMNLAAQRNLQKILDDQLSFSDATIAESGIYELQGALTVVDNQTGKVVAMIGGRSQDEISQTYSLNRAYQGYAQPGSSIKPLVVYTPALNEGYTAESQLTEIDVSEAKDSTSEKISKMTGTHYNLRDAVENSRNGCAYWLFNIVTPRVGLSYITEMNFSKIVPDDYNLSAALGGLTKGVTTVEMANAYSTLANHGTYTQTDCIASILDANGQEIYEDPQSKSVYSAEAADRMTDVLRGVLTKGTADNSNWYSYTDTEAAGKTGTTNNYVAGWFCGYTPYYSIAVWVGCDQWKTVKGLSGNTYPLSIWKEAMLYMIDGLPAKSFDIDESYTSNLDDWSSEDEIIEDVPEDEEGLEDEGLEETPDETDIDGTIQDDSQSEIVGDDIVTPSTGQGTSTGGTTGGSIGTTTQQPTQEPITEPEESESTTPDPTIPETTNPQSNQQPTQTQSDVGTTVGQ
jgi:membrane peptidoglycan carboxypeptidase